MLCSESQEFQLILFPKLHFASCFHNRVNLLLKLKNHDIIQYIIHRSFAGISHFLKLLKSLQGILILPHRAAAVQILALGSGAGGDGQPSLHSFLHSLSSSSVSSSPLPFHLLSVFANFRLFSLSLYCNPYFFLLILTPALVLPLFCTQTCLLCTHPLAGTAHGSRELLAAVGLQSSVGEMGISWRQGEALCTELDLEKLPEMAPSCAHGWRVPLAKDPCSLGNQQGFAVVLLRTLCL